jgi:hypothetical protein
MSRTALAFAALPVVFLSGPALAQAPAPPPLPAAEGEPDAAPASPGPPAPTTLPSPPAYAAPPRAEATPGVHLHDGFYLRLSIGPGYGTFDGEVAFEHSEFGGSGFAHAGALMLGGTPAPGLVVGGALASHTMPKPRYETDATVEGRPAASLGLLYGFVDYFPNPHRGFHVGGGAGLASFSYRSTNGDSIDQPIILGFGGAAWAGYDFWVGKQWSLGVEARASGAHVGNDGDNGPERSINAFGGAVLFTALYH